MNGKGGTGKTTVASLLVAHIASLKYTGGLLAIDADPNSNLAESLGVKDPESIVGTCEDISKNLDKMPAGMTKDRHIAMRVQEAVVEGDGFDLLVMGRPEGPGCYCYVNNLLRELINKITKSYEFVVIDNAAGMEHISRRTTRDMNKLLIVSDYSIPGIRSAKRIYDLARELGIKIGGAYLVVNRVAGPIDAVMREIEGTGLRLIGEIPYREEVVKWNISNRPIFELSDSLIKEKIGSIFQKMIGG